MFGLNDLQACLVTFFEQLNEVLNHIAQEVVIKTCYSSLDERKKGGLARWPGWYFGTGKQIIIITDIYIAHFLCYKQRDMQYADLIQLTVPSIDVCRSGQHLCLGVEWNATTSRSKNLILVYMSTCLKVDGN